MRPLRHAFNSLTTNAREELRDLKKQQQSNLEAVNKVLESLLAQLEHTALEDPPSVEVMAFRFRYAFKAELQEYKDASNEE